MLRFYPYYTKNHPFLISKTVFKINDLLFDYYSIFQYLIANARIRLYHIENLR